MRSTSSFHSARGEDKIRASEDGCEHGGRESSSRIKHTFVRLISTGSCCSLSMSGQQPRHAAKPNAPSSEEALHVPAASRPSAMFCILILAWTLGYVCHEWPSSGIRRAKRRRAQSFFVVMRGCSLQAVNRPSLSEIREPWASGPLPSDQEKLVSKQPSQTRTKVCWLCL